MKTLQINGEHFPYENPQYADVDRRITGQHLVHCFTPEIPETLRKKLESANLIDIRTMAEIKVLEQYPEYEELTSYGTRKKGYYKLVNAQIPKTMYWALNKQPASFTIITSKIDGISRKEDEPTDPNTVFGKIQLCAQIGVTVQIVIPETGYSCVIEAPVNKKQMDIFSKRFICEKYMAVLDNWELRDDSDPVVKEIIATAAEANMDLLMFANIVYKKCQRLQEYRNTIQENVWKLVNYATAPYLDEWKQQNVFTLGTRMGFAINSQTEDILNKYASDFRIPEASKLTINHLYDKKIFDEMIRIIQVYGPAFGVSVKTSESETDTMTYLPHKWVRDDKKTITEAVMLKRASMIQQSLKRAPLNELLQAYIQIDWYMSQPNPEDFYVIGYTKCECGKPMREVVTHYYNHSIEKLYNMDEYTNYNYKYNEYADYVTPVTVCQYCGKIHDADDFELIDPVSYEALAYRLDRDEE